MPSFAGLIAGPVAWQEPPAWMRSTEIDELAPPPPPPAASWAAALAISGALTNTQPVTEPGLTQAGALGRAFGADWYDRIHVLPARLDVGNVISTVVRTVEVWNAWSVTRVLGSITAEGGLDGVALSGPPAPPLAYLPLASRLYTVTVATAGPAVIDHQLLFDFGSELPRLAIVGRRVVVFGFAPDWSGGMDERLEWVTEVLPAYDGSEQRVRLRQAARRQWGFGVLAVDQDATRLDHLLFGWGGRRYALPVWPEADRLPSPLAVGATTVMVSDAALKDYRAGGLLVLVRDAAYSEAGEILSIAGNTLTLKLPLANAFPAGARVMPALLARLDGEVSLSRPHEGLARCTLRFTVEDDVDRAAAEIGPIWQGYAVLDVRPDRSDELDETWTRTLAVLDNLSGMVSTDDTTGAPLRRRQARWLAVGRSAIDAWKRWAAARAGRANPLWLPSFADELRPTATIAPTDTAVKVQATLYARMVAAHPLRAALRIETVAGQIFHRRITGATALSEAEESLAIDSALGVTLAPADVRRMMFMALARLDADALELHYETDNVAVLAPRFVEVLQ